MAVSEEQRTRAVKRWGDMVWRLALARTANVADAEDVFQEVFLRYFRHEDRFDSDEHRKAWLIRCTVNRAKSLVASPWRRRTVPLETAEEVGVEDDYREVYSVVLSLPAKYRTAIHLHYFEGLSVAEMAETLNVPEGTVKSQLSRGRALLREMLQEVEL
ncbi:MAG: RNA polymerase sigma factor [Oscillospiraceae bacterium]|nr:RNA polymerase sigma factor [Oscillospiraceae bacterium]MDE6839627.1 RNA polymerase sigma factor [Oscillospiraceae bacterium]